MLTDYRTADMCATVHVRHAMTDRNTRALRTRGHARPRVHYADRRIANFCVHRSLCYSTRARWLYVGTPADMCTVYGRSVLNLRARAGHYTTECISGLLGRYSHEPCQSHRHAVQRVFLYLRHIPTHGITYTNPMLSQPLLAYSDSDYASFLDTHRSKSGFVAFRRHGPIA